MMAFPSGRLGWADERSSLNAGLSAKVKNILLFGLPLRAERDKRVRL